MVNPISISSLVSTPYLTAPFSKKLNYPGYPGFTFFVPILPTPSIPHHHPPTCKWPWGCMKPPITPKVQKRSELSWKTPRDTATGSPGGRLPAFMVWGRFWGWFFWPTKKKKIWIQSFHIGSVHENLRHRVAYKVGNRVGTTHVSGCLSTLSVLVRHHARNDSVVAILSCNQAKLIFQNQQYPCSRWLIWMRAGSQILLRSCTSRHSWCLGVMMMYLHGLKSHKNVWKKMCEIWCSCFSCFCRFM